MTDFLSDWLALREPADVRARSTAITDAVVAALPRERPLRCLDLASGTGSNIRYLSPLLPQPLAWVATDRDASLLAHVPTGVETRCMELGSLDDPALFSGYHLVTASALLDLVSARWITLLAHRCRDAGSAVLFALNYDGRSRCDPRLPEDDVILQIFNRHQRSNDKGFGTAAGPDAAAFASHCFAEAGYSVRRARSDWDVPPAESAMQRRLVEGWAEAAKEIAPDESDTIGRWLSRRLAHVDAGRSRITVGHEDMGAWLAK